MWLQNLLFLGCVTMYLVPTSAQDVAPSVVAPSDVAPSDVRKSGKVRIQCMGDDGDVNLSLAVVDKSLNDLKKIFGKMCENYSKNKDESSWDAVWIGENGESEPAPRKENGDESTAASDTATSSSLAQDVVDDVTKIEAAIEGASDNSEISADESEENTKETDATEQELSTAATNDQENNVEEQIGIPEGFEPPEIVTVNTFLGRINGHKSRIEGNTYVYTFLGIPYAQAPVGNKRFKPPMPVTAYGELDAFGFKAECPQVKFYGPEAFKYVGNEDCLFLNIFSPAITTSPEALKPVMVWIHGGGFTSGSANEYIPVALTDKEVVVVTLNYRLSGFGFMTFGNDIVSGNIGLRDQLEALRWVKRFIHHFGGDPSKITIFGQGSGGISVHALHLSPKSKDLISGAIMQSGNMLFRKVRWDVAHEERNAYQIAEKYKCSSLNYDDAMLECLQSIPAEDFFMQTQYVGDTVDKPQEDRERSLWFPMVDAYSTDPVLPVEPLEALKSGQFSEVPVMSGTIKNDGALQVMGLLGPAPEKQNLWAYIGAQQLYITKSGNITETQEEEVYLAILATQYYTHNEFDLRETGQGWVDLFTDASYLSPDKKLMDSLVEAGRTGYNYVLDYVPNNTYAKFYGAPDNSVSPVHGEDVLHLFEQFGDVRLSTEEEMKVSGMMIEYWTNFAKYGNPSPFMHQNLTQWKPYAKDKRYLELKPEAEMKENYVPQRMLFWEKLYWNQREDEIDRWSLYKKLTKIFLGINNPNQNKAGNVLRY